MIEKPAIVMINTLIGGATGALFAILARYVILVIRDPINLVDIMTISNGTIAGMISVCASADRMLPWQSFIVGALAAVLYTVLVLIFDKLKIDDPIEAS